jgi:hypothetical protein
MSLAVANLRKSSSLSLLSKEKKRHHAEIRNLYIQLHRNKMCANVYKTNKTNDDVVQHHIDRFWHVKKGNLRKFYCSYKHLYTHCTIKWYQKLLKSQYSCLNEKICCNGRSHTLAIDCLNRIGVQLTSDSYSFLYNEEKGGHTHNIEPSHSFEPTSLIVICYHHHITTLNINVSVRMLHWWESAQTDELHNIIYYPPWLAVTTKSSSLFFLLIELYHIDPFLYRCITVAKSMVMNVYMYTEALSW